jgi:putative ABC transport system permease protein
VRWDGAKAVPGSDDATIVGRRAQCRVMALEARVRSWRRIPRMTSDLRYVLRGLGRRPGLAATIVVTLALGLGLGAAVFSFADGYLFRPLPFPSPEQLYRVRDPHARIALLQRDTIALRQTAVGGLGFVEWSAGHRIVRAGIVIDGRRVPVLSYDVSPGFAETLKLPLLAGRIFNEADHREGDSVPVWASYRFWQREFGKDLAILGRSFPVDGPEPRSVTIVGILAPEVASFDLNNPPPDLVAPALAAAPTGAPENRLSFPIVRLPGGTTREEGEGRIAAALQAVAPAADGRARAVELRPLRDSQVAGGAPTARVLLAGALLILLLVTMNLVHLLLAQGVARAREVATRTALGATRWRVMRLFLIEGLVFGVPGIAGGILVGSWLSQIIAARIPQYPTMGRNLALVPMAFDLRVVACAVAVGLLIALVSGLWPAWRAIRGRLNLGMHMTGGGGSGLPRRLSRAVLASQLAVATTLLLGTVFIGMGIRGYLHQPLGYSIEDRMVVSVQFDGRPPAPSEWATVRAAMTTIPGVKAVGAYRLGRGEPIESGGEAQPKSLAYDVSEGFFDAWQVRFSAGRRFAPDEYRTAAPVAIVDAALARRMWPGVHAVGQDLRVGAGAPRRVVGVVETQVRHLRNEPAGEAYIPKPAPPQWLSFVAWAPEVPVPELERRLEPITKEIVPAGVVRVEPVTKTWLFNRQTGEAEFQGPLMGAFALLTFILAGVGIFGLVSYLVAQRTREFGIRLVLGAGGRDIWRTVLRESVTPSAAGLVIGVGVARLLEGYVRSSVFGWEASGAAAVAVVAVAVLAVAIVAAVSPARRALRIDPATVLRAE